MLSTLRVVANLPCHEAAFQPLFCISHLPALSHPFNNNRINTRTTSWAVITLQLSLRFSEVCPDIRAFYSPALQVAERPDSDDLWSHITVWLICII